MHLQLFDEDKIRRWKVGTLYAAVKQFHRSGKPIENVLSYSSKHLYLFKVNTAFIDKFSDDFMLLRKSSSLHLMPC